MTTAHTNSTILSRFGVINLDLEYPDLETPLLTGPQRQGDFLVLPPSTRHAGRPLGPQGVEVVRSEAGGNTHTLHGDGKWEPNSKAGPDELVQGWVTVPDGGEAFLTHTSEHNTLGIGPGSYEVRTQREFAGIWQRVSD